MMSVQPDVTLQLAMSVISNISSYVRSIDFALDWVLIESGQVTLDSHWSMPIIIFSHWSGAVQTGRGG